MSDRPDMVVPSIEGKRWGKLGERMTSQERAAAVDALAGKLASRDTIDPDDLCPHCGATQGVCSDAMNAAARDNVVSILTDLIAQLRDFPLCSDNGGGDSGLCGADDLAGHLADRAEARLREVRGE